MFSVKPNVALLAPEGFQQFSVKFFFRGIALVMREPKLILHVFFPGLDPDPVDSLNPLLFGKSSLEFVVGVIGSSMIVGL